MSNIDRDYEDTIVEHKFTPEELAKLNKELVEYTMHAVELSEEADRIKKDYSARVKYSEQERNTTAAKLRRGSEERMKRCIVERDYRSWTVRYIDPDTYMLAKERPMRSDEREQMRLPLDVTITRKEPDEEDEGAEEVEP